MNQKIEELVFRYLCGECDEHERSVVRRWIDASPRNRNRFETAADIVRGSSMLKGYGAIGKEEARRRIMTAVGRQVSGRIRSRRMMRFAAAAMIAVCLGAGGYFVMRERTQTSFADIMSGSNLVSLTLSDGSVVELTGANSRLFDAGRSIEIAAEKNTVNYTTAADSASLSDTVMNRITVPRGCRHNITLSDGTRVQLNSGSELEFPVAFGAGDRRVRLSGEAWFEVTADAGRKFTVQLDAGAVEVTGTSFNVSSYPDDTFSRTVLEKGAVDFVDNRGRATHIDPGQSALFDIASATVTVGQVDVRLFTSWKDGICYFRNASLGEITKTLGRIYDVEFEFRDPEIKRMRFSGAVLCEKPISFILELLEQADPIKFTLVGPRKLTVSYD